MPSACASDGVSDVDRLAVDPVSPAVDRIGACQHLHQRRLAGAVVAPERDDLAARRD
jgi:hypothetical protein